jgi:hypothetical protein
MSGHDVSDEQVRLLAACIRDLFYLLAHAPTEVEDFAGEWLRRMQEKAAIVLEQMPQKDGNRAWNPPEPPPAAPSGPGLLNTVSNPPQSAPEPNLTQVNAWRNNAIASVAKDIYSGAAPLTREEWARAGVFVPCENCTTMVHCHYHRRCLSECVPPQQVQSGEALKWIERLLAKETR